jgi:hypothetical protein
MDASPRAVAPLLAVWLLLLAAFFTPTATWSPMSRFAVTRAAASGEGFRLGAWAAATGDRARVGEAWYSDKAPLPALLGVAPYALVRAIHRALGRPVPAFQAETRGEVPAVRVTLNASAKQLLHATAMGVSGAAFVVLALHVHAMLRRRHGPRAAFVATSLVCLGTPILPYATSLYGHVPAAAFLTVALASLDPRAPRVRPVLAGACLVAAVGCEYLAVIPGALLGAYALLSVEPRSLPKRLAWLALGALPVIALLATYQTLCFGAPWRTGYSHLTNPIFVAGHARGLMGIGLPSSEALVGLLVSSRRGLFYVAPIAALAVAGFALRARSVDGEVPPREGPRVLRWLGADPLLGLGGLALLALFLANAGYYMWWGGAAAGPRHLVPALPVLAFGLARVWEREKVRPLVLLAGALSVLVMLGVTAVGIEAPETGDVIGEFILPRLRAGEISAFPSATNLGLLFGLPPFLSLVPWLAWLAIVGRILWRRAVAEEAAS